MTPRRLDGSVALVTGAGAGLGRAYAEHLAARGAAVVVNDYGVTVRGEQDGDGANSAESAAEQVARQIRSSGGRAVADTGSVADRDQAEVMVRRAIEEFGTLDIVVCNAGISRAGNFGELPLDDMATAIDVHLFGTINVLAPAWRQLAANGGGSIITTTSSVGLFGQPRSSAYAAAKMGIIGLTTVLAQEGAAHGIRVNAVAPVAQSRMSVNAYGELTPHLPPSHVAELVVALAHPDTTVTGEVFSAGGGRVARIVIGTAEGHFDPDMRADELVELLPSLAAQQTTSVPSCAMEEIDLIRACYPDQADHPLFTPATARG